MASNRPRAWDKTRTWSPAPARPWVLAHAQLDVSGRHYTGLLDGLGNTRWKSRGRDGRVRRWQLTKLGLRERGNPEWMLGYVGKRGASQTLKNSVTCCQSESAGGMNL